MRAFSLRTVFAGLVAVGSGGVVADLAVGQEWMAAARLPLHLRSTHFAAPPAPAPAPAPASAPAPLLDVQFVANARRADEEAVSEVEPPGVPQPPAALEAPVELEGVEELASAVGDSARPACACGAESQQDALRENVAGAYRDVFYANDFSYVTDPRYNQHFLGDSLKQVDGPLGTADFGGEFRVRYHHEENFSTPGQGLTGNSADFWLNRTRLFANWRISPLVRIYAEGIHADVGSGGSYASRPIDVNRTDVQNLFADVKLLDNGRRDFTARLGRQELLYGNERLISPLDWANTRRTFEGYKGLYTSDRWNIDGFWVRPMERTRRYFDTFDSPDEEQQFYGIYASRKGSAFDALETYWLAYDNDNAGFRYDTLGFRVAGSQQSLLYELEAGYQFGRDADGGSHSAGAVTAGVGRKFASLRGDASLAPTVWFWYDYASGDETVGNGWHHLFPLAHKYLGWMDLYGRRNINDVNVQVNIPLTSRLQFVAWYHHFFLDQATTPYSVTLAPFATAAENVNGARELGDEIDLALTAALTPRQQLILGYSHFDSGAYYDNPGFFSGDAHFAWAQYHVRF